MRFSCFRQPSASALDLSTDPPRKKTIKRTSTSQSTGSRASVQSNSSISQLPPCDRSSDPKIEAMMMPLPEESRPSRCLRLSQPKTYSNIIDGMKYEHKGRRDWRNLDVFHTDEVDMSISAADVARRRAADYERKLRMLSSFSDCEDRRSIEVDMIGALRSAACTSLLGHWLGLADRSTEDTIAVDMVEISPPSPKPNGREISLAYRCVASPTSTTSPSNATLPRCKPHDALLMRAAATADDRARRERHILVRRRIKKYIFQDLDVDWRNMPTVEESSFPHATLRHRRDLRCQASRKYLEDFVKDLQRREHPVAISPNSDSLLIAGEEVVDMIG